MLRKFLSTVLPSGQMQKRFTTGVIVGCVFLVAAAFFVSQIRLKAARKSLKIVAFGVSTTMQLYYPNKRPIQIFTRILQEELGLWLPGVNVSVINSGYGGNDTDRAMIGFDRDVLSHKPDVLVLQFGINDATAIRENSSANFKERVSKEKFIANMKYFISEAKRLGSQVILLTPNRTCWDEPTMIRLVAQGTEWDIRLMPYVEGLRDLAKTDSAIAFIDVYDLLHQKILSRPEIEWLPDCIHPHHEAHRVVGNHLLQKIHQIYFVPRVF